MVQQPLHGRPDVLMISLQLLRPTALFCSAQSRFGALCKRQVVGRMSIAGTLELSTRCERPQAILTDGGQHVESWLPRFLFPLHEQTVIHQGGELIADRSDVLASCRADR